MATDLLGLGLFIFRWLGRRLAFQFARSSLVKHNHSILAEYLRGWLQKDIDLIGARLSSYSHSKLSSSLHFVRRALIIMRRDLSSVSELQLTAKIFTPGNDVTSTNRNRSDASRSLSDHVTRLLTEADKWATEAFFDRANVPLELRIEAAKIQLFCTLLLHHSRTHEILLLWKEIFDEISRDQELIQLILRKTWLLKDSESNLHAKNFFVDFIHRLRSAVLGFCGDAEDRKLLLNLWRSLLDFNFTSDKDKITWYNTSFGPIKKGEYKLIDQFCLLITQPVNQFCILPNNQLCTSRIDRQKQALCIQVFFNNEVLYEEQLPLDDCMEQGCSVAYDQKRDSILVIKRKSIELFDRNLHNLGRMDEDMLMHTDKKQISCTKNGIWIMLNETLPDRIFVKWYTKSDGFWTEIKFNLDHLSELDVIKKAQFITIMDVRDAEILLNSEEAVEILLRFKSNSCCKFIKLRIPRKSAPSSAEIHIDDDLHMMRLDDHASMWMLFHSEDCEKFLLLWSEGKSGANLVALHQSGRIREEYFSPAISLPFGIQQAVCKLPYVFLATMPRTFGEKDSANCLTQF